MCIYLRTTAPAYQISHLPYTVYTPDIISININSNCNRFTNVIHMNRRDSQRVCYRIKSWGKRRRGRSADGGKGSKEPRRRRNPLRYFGVEHGRKIQRSREWGCQGSVVWVIDQTCSRGVRGSRSARCDFILTGSDVHSSQVRMTRYQLVNTKLCLPLHLDVACRYPGPEDIFC